MTDRQRSGAENRACQAELGCRCQAAPGNVTADVTADVPAATDLGSLSAHFPILGSLVAELFRGLRQLPHGQRAPLAADLQQLELPTVQATAGHVPRGARPEVRSAGAEPSSPTGGRPVVGSSSLPRQAAGAGGSAAAVPGKGGSGGGVANESSSVPPLRQGRDSRTTGTGGGRRSSGQLTWGSTRTQKLRLLLTNPEALQWQESHERLRQPRSSAALAAQKRRQPVEEEAGPAAYEACDDEAAGPAQSSGAADVAVAWAATAAAATHSSADGSERGTSRVTAAMLLHMTGRAEDESQTANSRKSLDVRLPVARPPSSAHGSENTGSGDMDGSYDDDNAGSALSSAGGSLTYSGPELVGSQESEGEGRHGTELDDVTQYRRELSRLAAAATTATMTSTLTAKVPLALPPPPQKKDGGAREGHFETTEKLRGTTVVATAASSGSARSGLSKESNHEPQQQQEMSKIAEQSEPEGSYSDSFDSDISKSVSLPIMADASDGESSQKLRSEPYVDLPFPRASQASPTLHGRPANPPLSRSNPALQRSSSQQEGKPPLSSRSRGGAQSSSETLPPPAGRSRGMGSADSSRATSIRASDASGRSASRGGGGDGRQPTTPDAGDSDSSFRALRARNEERRKRLSRSFKDDMNTESVSSYDPSERGQSRGSSSPEASDDWSSVASSSAGNVNAMTLNRLAPANKLGYTT